MEMSSSGPIPESSVPEISDQKVGLPCCRSAKGSWCVMVRDIEAVKSWKGRWIVQQVEMCMQPEAIAG